MISDCQTFIRQKHQRNVAFANEAAKAAPPPVVIMENTAMARDIISRFKQRGPLSARRLALLAGVGALSVATLLGASGGGLQPWAFAAPSAARAAEVRPASFADVAEKVMPAVVSVRVKVQGAQQMGYDEENGPEPGSPAERFF